MRKMLNLLLILITFLFSGCFNNQAGTEGGGTTTTAKAKASKSKTTTSNAGGELSFTITNVVINKAKSDEGAAENPDDEGAGAASETAQFFFNANSTDTLNDVCQVQQGGGDNTNPAKACKCRFVWGEKNLSDSSVLTRTVDTDPTVITSFDVQCPVPDVFDSEIVENTTIKVSLVPDLAAGSTSRFKTNVMNIQKKPNVVQGDFRDSEGRGFKNVFHYVCFDRFKQNLFIGQQIKSVGNQNPATQNTPQAKLANRFELGQGSNPESFSAQNYYFDFYVRSHEIGSINSINGGFTCPTVNVNGTPSFFPLDSTFALALNPSADFRVKVESNIVIQAADSKGGTLLGFAARPNPDGSCPAFPDSTGKIRRTFRLRKFTAVYPLRYDADGNILDKSQKFNSLYIMDRPVDKVGQDPFKPITRYGPKPCPFSFKTFQFGQRCSTDASLAGWNVNGIQVQGDPVCPIYPPIPDKWLKSDGTLVIRPFKPFLPHYLEDTTFKACAFPSSTAIDPEIVLSHDDTIFPNPPGPNDFYCAKHYPPAGAIIPPAFGDAFDKAPGDCDFAQTAAAMKTDLTYSCTKTFDPTNNVRKGPAAGCCQICSGTNCVAQGGGTTAAGRNLAFSPPRDIGNPPQSIRLVPRATPNQTGGSGCFDPSED